MTHLRDYKDCSCIGIEVNRDSVNQARAQGFTVVHENAQQGLSAVSEYQPFDHIIFGDVLEHMIDPLSVLKASRDLLSQNGTVLVSLPNIVSLVARARLCLGVWRYEDSGIFDRTHLRFFTVRTGHELIEKAGFTMSNVSYVGPLTFYGGHRFLRVTALRPGLLANQMVFEAHATSSAR